MNEKEIILNTEMDILEQLMNKDNIPYEKRYFFNGVQICYPNVDKFVCSAVCHDYSYGHEEGLIEILGLVDHDEDDNGCLGWLSAAEVFERIKNHFENNERR